MPKLGTYLRLLFKEAFKKWTGRLEDWQARVIGFFFQSAIFFLALYFMPILGSLKDESRLVFAGGGAIVLSTILLFLIDLFTAPWRVHRELAGRLEEREQIIKDIFASERGLMLLSDLYSDGKDLYCDMQPVEEYVCRLKAWEAKVSGVLKRSFSISDQFQFRKAGAGLEYHLPGNADPDWAEKTREFRIHISGKISSLEHIIEFGGGNFIGASMAYEELRKNEKASSLPPISTYLSKDGGE